MGAAGILSINPAKVSDFPSHLPEASCWGRSLCFEVSHLLGLLHSQGIPANLQQVFGVSGQDLPR